ELDQQRAQQIHVRRLSRRVHPASLAGRMPASPHRTTRGGTISRLPRRPSVPTLISVAVLSLALMGCATAGGIATPTQRASPPQGPPSASAIPAISSPATASASAQVHSAAYPTPGHLVPARSVGIGSGAPSSL